jgi:hypothetical protein
LILEAAGFRLARSFEKLLGELQNSLRLSPPDALLSEDIRRRLPKQAMKIIFDQAPMVIFDIGANVGQSTLAFLDQLSERHRIKPIQ